MPQHEVDERPLPAEHFADAGHDGVLDCRPADHFLHRVREVLDNDDHLGAAVGQLMLELARGVQRIDIHDREAGAQDAEQAYRILQDVGHHERDARALLEPASLQKRAERGRGTVEVGECNGLAHAGVRRPRAELCDDGIEHVAQGRVGIDVDFGGDAFRVRLKPDPVHDLLPVARSYVFCS